MKRLHNGNSRSSTKRLKLSRRDVLNGSSSPALGAAFACSAAALPAYPAEGTPFVVGPDGNFKAAPNPNAAKLFQNYCSAPEAQATIIEVGGLRALHSQGLEHPGRTPLSDIRR